MIEKKDSYNGPIKEHPYLIASWKEIGETHKYLEKIFGKDDSHVSLSYGIVKTKGQVEMNCWFGIMKDENYHSRTNTTPRIERDLPYLEEKSILLKRGTSEWAIEECNVFLNFSRKVLKEIKENE